MGLGDGRAALLSLLVRASKHSPPLGCPTRMAHRGDDDSLKTKELTLASELSSLRRRESDVARSLDEARVRLRRERTLRLFDHVRRASPCRARWDKMSGDGRVRACATCAASVYDLSELTRDEAEALLAKNENDQAETCARVYEREDGTLLAADCAVGARRRRFWRVVAVAVATLGATTLAAIRAESSSRAWRST